MKFQCKRECLLPFPSPLTEGRGLKSFCCGHVLAYARVAPHGGAWIEIVITRAALSVREASPLTEGRGLKYWYVEEQRGRKTSPLTEGRGLKYLMALL